MSEQSHFEFKILAVILGFGLLMAAIPTLVIFAVSSFVDGSASGPTIFALAAAIVLVVGGGLAKLIAKVSTAPSSAAVRALSHVSASASTLTPPHPKTYKLGQKLVEHITKDIYDLAAGNSEKQSEMANQSKFNQALVSLQSNPLISLDRNYQINFSNNAARSIMPQSIDSPIGMSLEDAVSPEFSSGVTFKEWAEEALANKIEDSKIWERVRITPEEGVIRYFDMVVDYHKNQSAGLEFIVSLVDKSEEYTTDLNTHGFVSMAVHELRTPISLLRGYIEVFEDEIGPSLTADLQSFMHKMSVSASLLSTFTNNILNVARIDNDQLKVHLQEDDINKAMADMIDDFTLHASVKKRSLTYEPTDNLPSVGLDRIALYEVMNNLIDNAIKYSPEQGAVNVKTEPSNNGGVIVTVADHGIGIPESNVKNLFQRFYRSHHSRDVVSGTGLGLFLCKSFIEAHGGTIWVKSKEGEGSTFGFELPAFTSLGQDLLDTQDANGAIVRSAHGWIKNHGKMRG